MILKFDLVRCKLEPEGTIWWKTTSRNSKVTKRNTKEPIQAKIRSFGIENVKTSVLC